MCTTSCANRMASMESSTEHLSMLLALPQEKIAILKRTRIATTIRILELYGIRYLIFFWLMHEIQCTAGEITVGGMSFLATGEEENETSSSSGESVGSDSTPDPEALDETAEEADKTDYNVDDDEIVVLCDDLGAASSDEDTSSSETESEELDESLYIKERLSNGASRDEVAETQEGVDGQAPEVESLSLSLSIEEESDGEDYPDHGLPAVVSLFFKHPVITEVIDEIESSALAEEGKAVCAWDITRAIEVFARLVEQRNSSLKLSKKPSRAAIMSTIHELYSQQFIPFLRSLGIVCSAEAASNFESNTATNNTKSLIWRWDETVVNYVDLIYIDAFRNLTENGTIAHSRTFLQLFPNLFMHADSGASSSIFNVCSKLQNILESKGKFNTGVDSVVVMIDQLSDEKKNLLKLESEFEEEKKGQANESEMNAQTLIGQQLSDCRKKRLQEIEALLNSLEEVFFKLTGAIDHIEPKKKLPKQKKPKKEKKNKEKKPKEKKETVKKPSAPKKEKPVKSSETKPKEKKISNAKSDTANGSMEIEGGGTEKKPRKKPVKKQSGANGEGANGVENCQAKAKPARKKAGKAAAKTKAPNPIEAIPNNDLNSLVNTNDVGDRSCNESIENTIPNPISPVAQSKAAFDDEIDMDVEITEKLRNIDIKDTL